MRNKSIVFLIGVVLVGGFAAYWKKSAQMATAAHVLYHCAMHPQIISDKPGECPICHMRLIPLTPSLSPGERAQGEGPRKILFYRNPMNPSATSPVPMKDSMGMAYVPVYETEPAASEGIPGLAEIHLAPGVEQRIGVTVAAAEKRDLAVAIRAAARVAYDPQLYT